MKTTYNIEEIKEIIPHRDPMLLIDEIVDVDEEGEFPFIVAQKEITGDESFFKGHFPEYKVMPGVLILEAMAQTGAFYVLSQDEYKGKIAMFIGADNVKWRRQVLPGEKLKLKVELLKLRRGIGSGNAWAYVAGSLVCEAFIKFLIK